MTSTPMDVPPDVRDRTVGILRAALTANGMPAAQAGKFAAQLVAQATRNDPVKALSSPAPAATATTAKTTTGGGGDGLS